MSDGPRVDLAKEDAGERKWRIVGPGLVAAGTGGRRRRPGRHPDRRQPVRLRPALGGGARLPW